MIENQQPEHHMILEKVDPSGIEEWHCPTCGRRFLMKWPPEYKKTVLEPGDEYVIHIGGKGLPGMEMSMISTIADPGMKDVSDESGQLPVNEESLLPWTNWTKNVDFNSLWTKPLQ